MNDESTRGINPAFYILITVFFFWGFVAASNGVFIPFCKAHFNLTQLESQLIDFAFYSAYFIGSLLLYLFSAFRGVDILNKIGYKKGIIYGLLISVAGALLLIGVVNLGNGMENKSTAFFLILGAFFVVALGFSLQQTAANPFAVMLGDPSTGAHRLNAAEGVNSFGTTIGPIVVAILLFGTASENGQAAVTDISTINKLYLMLAGLFLLAAVIFAVTKMPRFISDEIFEKTGKATRSMLGITFFFLLILIGVISRYALPLFVLGIVGILGILLYSFKSAQRDAQGWGAMRYAQLVLGMTALFVYVGVEVTIQSNMGALLEQPGFLSPAGLDKSQIDPYISLYWGSLMIGRWTAAITIFNLSGRARKLMTVIVPFIGFGVVLGVNIWKGNQINDFYLYAICILVLVFGFFIGQEKPARTLLVFGGLGTAAMLIGLFTTGQTAAFAFMSGGLFCSVMWPCIFALSITGLGKYTSQASAFLIMMILGGALIPPIQGGLADMPALGIHRSYIIPVLGFAYIAFFGYRVRSILKAQGLDYEAAVM
ncbi:MFS transporter [Compostibacter hankyongensis]|uniref:MFS transporter n=1 Tax=Compostibacter hankyongensis TaxID=1007089 RepID=A0ABP8FJ19_9BACT